jgi:hypothetical protein
MDDGIVELPQVPGVVSVESLLEPTIMPRPAVATPIVLNVNSVYNTTEGMPESPAQIVENENEYTWIEYRGPCKKVNGHYVDMNGNQLHDWNCQGSRVGGKCETAVVEVEGISRTFVFPHVNHIAYSRIRQEFEKLAWSKNALENLPNFVSVYQGGYVSVYDDTILIDNEQVAFTRKPEEGDLKRLKRYFITGNRRIIRDKQANLAMHTRNLLDLEDKCRIAMERQDLKDIVFSKLDYNEIETFGLVESLNSLDHVDNERISTEGTVRTLKEEIAKLLPVRQKRGELKQIKDSLDSLYSSILEGIIFGGNRIVILFRRNLSITYRGTTIEYGRPRIIVHLNRTEPIHSIRASSRDCTKFIHPHISPDSNCLGTFKQPMCDAVKRGDLARLVVLIWEFLNNFNDQSPLNGWSTCLERMKEARPTRTGGISYEHRR